jgi:asparagine synthase (glutamine-hydrolysing)
MCGICGQFNFVDQAPVLKGDLRSMTDSIVHRGPDDEGYFLDGSLGLGFRRLSIIDLAGGHQPMSDADESVWVVFNGEIYNFPELKSELISLGYVFRTNCDTEVIVHGYRQWGQDVLNHLNGMFGLAIWDVRRRRLILARDPFGIKLLYYRIDNGRLRFGSEIRAVAAVDHERPDVDPVSLNLFLRYRYTPSPHTIYKGIRKLAPGTMLICENGESRVRRWYQYEAIPFSPMKSPAEACEELLELYRRAIRRHLLSDVPVGLLLSGGLDSALLLALMNECGRQWPTYSVGYGSSYVDDELADAASTAAHFESLHTSVTLTREVFEQTLPGIVSCLEEPVASSSIVPMYFVSQRARQDVKVTLMGQGPDELFGGYRRHLGVRYGGIYKGLPSAVRGSIASAVGLLPRNETLKRAIYSLDVADRLKRYQNVLSLMPGERIDKLFRDGLLDSDTGDAILDSWQDLAQLSGKTDELGGFQFIEMRSSLPDELLMYADKLSMAHSLEVRVPYLDREVVEYAERLSADFKVRRGVQKWLHRRVSASLVPGMILRRKKRGFAVNVVDQWFKGAIGSRMEETLLSRDSLLYNYLRPAAVREMFNQHNSGRHDNHKVLFSLVVFDQWLRAHSSPRSVAA